MPDAHHLAADGYDVQDGDDQEQNQAQTDGWEHRSLVEVREDGFDEVHVVATNEEKDDPCNDENHYIQRDGKHLIWLRHIVRAVTYQQQILQLG